MCAKKKTAESKPEAQNPLILRCHRLIEAFAKSDEERDFLIDRLEGFLIYMDLDKSEEELNLLEDELHEHADRYCIIPKLSYYETKKIMEGFINEKVYDIDTKEKLLDIIQSKEAKENFLEFIADQHAEWEKWQQYYLERSRVRIIEWLRQNHFYFVFEEDLELPRMTIEQLKDKLFEPQVEKEIASARKILVAKAKSYYSTEALNPRPKRGRPPKQSIKIEIEPQVTIDRYKTIPDFVRPFLFSPEFIHASNLSPFSSKLEPSLAKAIESETSIQEKLSVLRSLSSRWIESDIESEEVPEQKQMRREKGKLPLNKKGSSAASSKSAQKPKSNFPAKSTSKTIVGKAKPGAAKASATKAPAKKPPVKSKQPEPEGKKRLKKIMPRKAR